jgi:diacylglycerol kinase (ATP)
MTQYKIIVNPISGRGSGAAAIPQLTQLLEQYQLNFDLVQTRYPWHAAELAQQAVEQGFQVVVAVGGDGTLNEVINGLMLAKDNQKGEAALGVISVGRGNDFAFGAGIPPEMEQAVQILSNDQRQWIDVGFVAGGDYPNGRYFGNGVGVGFDAVVGFEALKMKRLHGFPSYLIAALKTIFLYYHAPKVLIEFDSQALELNTLMISIMNGRRMGGGFHMAPRAQMNDSLFDLCIAKQVSRPKIITLIPRFMKGDQANHPAIQTAQTRCLTIRALQGSLPVHADGETICIAGQELEITILPRQIEILSDRASSKNGNPI